ncbi:MAG: hypothetical protein AB7F59_14595, partial [Bdellovibrionales bacterium]
MINKLKNVVLFLSLSFSATCWAQTACEPSIADRIQKFRPDIAYLMQNPDKQVDYAVQDSLPITGYGAVNPNIRQDRSCLTVYRGIAIPPEKYDSQFSKFKLGGAPNQMYTSLLLDEAYLYASNEGGKTAKTDGQEGIIIEYQFPMFLPLNRANVPIRTIDVHQIIDRNTVPDDSPFIRRIGILKQNHRRQSPEQIDQAIRTQIKWYTFDEIRARLPLVKPSPHIVFNSEGKFINNIVQREVDRK